MRGEGERETQTSGPACTIDQIDGMGDYGYDGEDGDFVEGGGDGDHFEPEEYDVNDDNGGILSIISNVISRLFGGGESDLMDSESLVFYMICGVIMLVLIVMCCLFCCYKSLMDILNTLTCGLFSTCRTVFKCCCSCVF